MKHLGIAVILSAALVLAGCGGSNNGSSSINGSWTATLTGTQNFSFTATLAQSGSTVTITNLSFTTSQSCFSSGATASGSFTLAGNTGGVMTGTFQMSILSAAGDPDGSNNLTLQGTLTGNSISGNWTLSGTGAGCTAAGTFTMND